MRSGEARKTVALLSTLRYFDIPESTARLGGELRNTWKRKGRTLSATDTLIAAVAIDHGLTLATDNLKDLPMPELKVLQPPRPN